MLARLFGTLGLCIYSKLHRFSALQLSLKVRFRPIDTITVKGTYKT